MKTYTNKSNAARAAKAANGGNLTGLQLLGGEGAWYYGPAEQQAPADALVPSLGTPTTGKAKKSAPAKKAAAKPAKPAKAAPAAKAPAKKAAVKKAAPVRKPAAEAVEYDPKNGPTQGRIRGYHIDTERDERHGLRRRSAGTIGGRLWTLFDKLATKYGGAEKLPIAEVKEHPEVKGVFNANKVVIEFYCWRRWNGVRGRGKKQKVDAK